MTLDARKLAFCPYEKTTCRSVAHSHILVNAFVLRYLLVAGVHVTAFALACVKANAPEIKVPYFIYIFLFLKGFVSFKNL